MDRLHWTCLVVDVDKVDGGKRCWTWWCWGFGGCLGVTVLIIICQLRSVLSTGRPWLHSPRSVQSSNLAVATVLKWIKWTFALF